MNVLQVTNAESSFFQTQLDALDHVGIDCDVSTPPTGGDGDRAASDYVRWLATVLRNGTESYDIVHANYGLTGPIAGAITLRTALDGNTTPPVVVSLWGSDVMGDSRLVDSVSRVSASYADVVIAPSTALADTLDADAEVVPFGVDTETFEPMDRLAAREQLDWPRDEHIALFPYDPSRDVKDYPRAEAVIDAADSHVTLKSISDVPHDLVPVYMNASDLVLVTSRREAGPMVVKEAAACNVPVVSTDVGFARSVLRDVDHSTVERTTADLAASIDAILATRERSNGRHATQVRSVEEMGTDLQAIYERISS